MNHLDLLLVSMLAIACTNPNQTSEGCSTDQDCKGDRICDPATRLCMSPGPSGTEADAGLGGDGGSDGDGPPFAGSIASGVKAGEAFQGNLWHMAADAAGNTVLLGTFRGMLDFGGGPVVSMGGLDIFLVKFSADGKHLWTKTIGSALDEMPWRVALDRAGNVIITGAFRGTADFGGGPLTSAGGRDIFVAKYSPMGTHLWSKRYGAAGDDDQGSVVMVDSGNNIVVGGALARLTDIGSGSPLYSGPNTRSNFIAKYNSDGVHLWSKEFGGTFAGVNAGAVDKTDAIIIGGNSNGTVDFGGGPKGTAGDEYLAKFATNGAYVWDTRLGAQSRPTAIAIDSSNNVLFVGMLAGTVDLGGGPLTNVNNSPDILLAKYTAAGAHVWSKGFGGQGFDYGTSIAVDKNDNPIISGSFADRIDFGGGPITGLNATKNIYIASFTAAGGFSWVKRTGGTGGGQAVAVALDGASNVITAGEFSGTIDFGGVPITAMPGTNIFLLRIAP